MSKVTINIESASMDFLRVLDEVVIVAGGAARALLTGEEVSDYDVFFSPGTDLGPLASLLVDAGWTIKFRCPAGELISLKRTGWADVQLIAKTRFSDPADLIDQFDFTVAQFAAILAGGEDVVLVTTPDSVIDLVRKRLRLHSLTYPIATLRRLFKYQARGFKAGPALFHALYQEIRNGEFAQEQLEYYPID